MGQSYREDHTDAECFYCNKGDFIPYDNYEKGLLCCELYGNLNFNSIDKILEVKRENDIVQYAKLIVNGETKEFFSKSIFPYALEHQPQVGTKLLHVDYGELTIIDVKKHQNKTIIRVQHSNGETSRMTWNILCSQKKIKILSF